MTQISRFAPTCSGRAHPGTLLAGMLAALDSRSRAGTLILRMEDIDPSSVTEVWRKELLNDLVWFGLPYSSISWQSKNEDAHADLLDLLSDSGRLYACSCTRKDLKDSQLASIAGGYRYPGTCRARALSRQNWRSCTSNIRINLSGFAPSIQDESGFELGHDLDSSMGDPLLRRADGTFTYQLAVVADDHTAGVTRIVRGRDLATSTATQVCLYNIAGWQVPQYRHHFLLLEPRGSKLAKFHGSIAVDVLSRHYTATELLVFLAQLSGLLREKSYDFSKFSLTEVWNELTQQFSWNNVQKDDLVLDWQAEKLIVVNSNQLCLDEEAK